MAPASPALMCRGAPPAPRAHCAPRVVRPRRARAAMPPTTAARALWPPLRDSACARAPLPLAPRPSQRRPAASPARAQASEAGAHNAAGGTPEAAAELLRQRLPCGELTVRYAGASPGWPRALHDAPACQGSPCAPPPPLAPAIRPQPPIDATQPTPRPTHAPLNPRPNQPTPHPTHALRYLEESDARGAGLLLTRAFAGTPEAVALDESM
jgi:hypothetical protein